MPTLEVCPDRWCRLEKKHVSLWSCNFTTSSLTMLSSCHLLAIWLWLAVKENTKISPTLPGILKHHYGGCFFFPQAGPATTFVKNWNCSSLLSACSVTNTHDTPHDNILNTFGCRDAAGQLFNSVRYMKTKCTKTSIGTTTENRKSYK